MKNYWKMQELNLFERSGNEELLEDVGIKSLWKMQELNLFGRYWNEEFLEDLGMKNY